MCSAHGISDHSMMPGFSGQAMALLLILQGVTHNRQNYEQPLSYSLYADFEFACGLSFLPSHARQNFRKFRTATPNYFT